MQFEIPSPISQGDDTNKPIGSLAIDQIPSNMRFTIYINNTVYEFGPP